jgi:phosphatidylinositol-3-phosphatase
MDKRMNHCIFTVLSLLVVVIISCAPGQIPTAAPNATNPPAPPRQPTATIPAPPTQTPPATQTPVAASAIKTVFIIVLENKNWAEIKGSASAPYINNVLLPQASHAEQYFNPPGIHPSLPNYLWLEAGTNFGILDDKDPSVHHQSTTDHLVTLLNHAGIDWKSYQESITGADCPLTNGKSYLVRHNPMLYFDDVTDNRNSKSAYCQAHVRPYSELAADLLNSAAAAYNFITPNVCNDMHNSCAPVNNPIRQGDNWLSREVPQILSAPAYQQGGVLFITWDEAEEGDGPIGMLVLSPFAKGRGYANNIHYTHSSTLKTIQAILGVRPFLGDAAAATDLSDLFSIALASSGP